MVEAIKPVQCVIDPLLGYKSKTRSNKKIIRPNRVKTRNSSFLPP
jgi:hypothetical protein